MGSIPSEMETNLRHGWNYSRDKCQHGKMNRPLNVPDSTTNTHWLQITAITLIDSQRPVLWGFVFLQCMLGNKSVFIIGTQPTGFEPLTYAARRPKKWAHVVLLRGFPLTAFSRKIPKYTKTLPVNIPTIVFDCWFNVDSSVVHQESAALWCKRPYFCFLL